MNSPKFLFKLLRPSQWLKSAFVFTGILFANAWNDIPLLINVILAAVGFCFLSSCIYIFNDIIDQEQDRHHPTKKNRPIAAGMVSTFCAFILATCCALIALSLGLIVSPKVLFIYIGYTLLNIAYSIWLKHVVILDVFCIAAGFMLRILAGTVGVGIPPSKWLLLCGLMITLFLGFAKRRAEIIALKEKQEDHRKVLSHYGAILLDEIIGICGTGVIITYSLYTMSPDTIKTHHTDNLIYTVPFVIYGLFRYLYLLHHRKSGGDPSRDVVKDPHILLSVLGWFFVTLMIIK